MSSLLPRVIAPELVEVGDKIRVTFPPKKGVRMSHEGVVSSIENAGQVRFLMTDEGATLVSWQIGGRNLSIMLLDRPPAVQVSLFDMPEVAERIS